MPTVSAENYLKAILHLQDEGQQKVSTTDLAEKVGATPASTSAMLKNWEPKDGWSTLGIAACS